MFRWTREATSHYQSDNEDQIENERNMANEVNPSKEKIMMSSHENVECQGITDNKEKMIDVDENNEYRFCKNCNWTGKRNALLKHLRMKPSCTSKYNMERVYDEQAMHKKLRKQHYDKI